MERAAQAMGDISREGVVEEVGGMIIVLRAVWWRAIARSIMVPAVMVVFV